MHEEFDRPTYAWSPFPTAPWIGYSAFWSAPSAFWVETHNSDNRPGLPVMRELFLAYSE